MLTINNMVSCKEIDLNSFNVLHCRGGAVEVGHRLTVGTAVLGLIPTRFQCFLLHYWVLPFTEQGEKLILMQLDTKIMFYDCCNDFYIKSLKCKCKKEYIFVFY